MGEGEGRNRECVAETSLPGCVHVSSGIHPAAARDSDQDGVVRSVYAVMSPLYPLLKMIAPKYLTTTEQLGRAMIIAAKHGAPKPILRVQISMGCREAAPVSLLRPLDRRDEAGRVTVHRRRRHVACRRHSPPDRSRRKSGSSLRRTSRPGWYLGKHDRRVRGFCSRYFFTVFFDSPTSMARTTSPWLANSF